MTGNCYFIVRIGESPGYLLAAIEEVSAHCCVLSGLNLYVHYSRAEKLLKEAFLRKIPKSLLFVSRGYVQNEGSEWRRKHCT